MKKVFVLLLIVCLNYFVFSQNQLGINLSGGFNQEVYNANYTNINKSIYKLSFETGVISGFDLTKRIGLNLELNYFYKNSQATAVSKVYHYVELPVYFSYKFNKFKILAGVANNVSINNNMAMNIYTLSAKTGLSYNVCDNISFRLVYNHELMSHLYPVYLNNVLLAESFFKSFMFGVVVDLKGFFKEQN